MTYDLGSVETGSFGNGFPKGVYSVVLEKAGVSAYQVTGNEECHHSDSGSHEHISVWILLRLKGNQRYNNRTVLVSRVISPAQLPNIKALLEHFSGEFPTGRVNSETEVAKRIAKAVGQTAAKGVSAKVFLEEGDEGDLIVRRLAE